MSRLKMPEVDALTEEQDMVLRLPDEGRYFVGGPPGTGKTIILLLRAIAMNKRRNPPETITFNWLLNNYCRQVLATRQLRLPVKTFHNWFKEHYRRNYGEVPPERERWQYDWDKIFDKCAANVCKPHNTPILIDEGQDLPRYFYKYISLHFANIMVFADENQMLDEKQNSTKEMIWAELGITNLNDRKYMLTINHRNTLQIAQAASHFYAGTDAGRPKLPSKTGKYPYLIEYNDHEYYAGRIARHAGLHPHALVGVLTANNASQELLRSVLEPICRKSNISFTCFRSGNAARVDFNKPGIVLLNLQSVKGLEFDSTLIADLHEHFVRREGVAHKMQLYVATSRATTQLYIFYNQLKRCPLLDHMPAEDILKRYTLRQGKTHNE